jgi:preprotein translocase subunit SecE
VTVSPAGRQVRGALFYQQASTRHVAKVSPGEFIRQVRAETAKVHWPTRKETVATGIMVIIMTVLLALFFFGVDAFFSSLVKFLLGVLAGARAGAA